MVISVVLSILAAALAGLIIKKQLDRRGGFERITWFEYVVGMAAFSIIIAPLIGWGIWEGAKKQKLSYQQFVNGWERQAVKTDYRCTRDGPCEHEYDCDPYTVTVSYECNCDEKGNCSTCYREETHYHSCPYVDQETTYTVQTTIGDFTISAYRFPDDPQRHRWRKYVSIPESVIDSAGVGIPAFWEAVRVRVAEGAPGPVTKIESYDNYIFASEYTILKQYSSEVQRYKQAGILPPIQSSIHDFYWSNKVSFVSWAPADAARLWQMPLDYFNAAFGAEREGDLRLVIVKNALADENPELYALTLKAYWQDHVTFGKFALPKNAVVVVAGTNDGETVSWARVFTGMPLGNEAMIVELQERLKGQHLRSEVILGAVRGKFTGPSVVVGAHGSGVIERVTCGLDDPAKAFTRISMTGKNVDDIGSGFLYLANEIVVDSWAAWTIFFVMFLMSLIGWFALAQVEIGPRR